MSKILVVAELRDGKLRNVSFEALTLARSLEANSEVSAVLLVKEQMPFWKTSVSTELTGCM